MYNQVASRLSESVVLAPCISWLVVCLCSLGRDSKICMITNPSVSLHKLSNRSSE